MRKQFLPRKFDPLGQYPRPARVQAHARAFLVLCHAEIESYLEGWAKEIARASEVVWSKSGKVTKPLAFLMATLSERIKVPETYRTNNSNDMPQRLSQITVQLFQNFYKSIKDNNGIKERNLFVLFGPLGIPSAALGATLLPNLDNLGAIRGTHAHNSSKAVQSVLDPETEYNRVRALLSDLAALDQWLVSYKRQVR